MTRETFRRNVIVANKNKKAHGNAWNPPSSDGMHILESFSINVKREELRTARKPFESIKQLLTIVCRNVCFL